MVRCQYVKQRCQWDSRIWCDLIHYIILIIISYYIFAAASQPLLTGCWGTQVLPPLSRAYVARQDFLLHQEVESTKQHQESPRSTGLEHSTSVQLQFPFKRCPWNWSLKNGWFSSFWAPAVMFTKNTLWGQRAKTLLQKEQVMKWWLGGVFFWTLGRFGINSDGTLIYSNSLGMFGLGGFETLSLSKDSWIPRPIQAFHWKLICCYIFESNVKVHGALTSYVYEGNCLNMFERHVLDSSCGFAMFGFYL